MGMGLTAIIDAPKAAFGGAGVGLFIVLGQFAIAAALSAQLQRPLEDHLASGVVLATSVRFVATAFGGFIGRLYPPQI